MLNTRTVRRPVGPAGRLTTLAVFATLAVGAATAQTRTATLSGTVVDQTSRLVPEAALVLTNAAGGESHEARTDRTGRFEFPPVGAGEYQLVVQRPGFKTFTETLSVAGSDMTRIIHLQIGSLQETLNIAGSTPEGPSAADSPASRDQARERARQSSRRASEQCSNGPTAGDLGGQVVPPVKLTHVRPEYPASLKGSGVGGVVTLDALIGADGQVRDITPVSSPHPDLERVSVDAVRRWEFSTTFLNCTPVEVPMRVVMKFDAQ